MNSLSGTWKIQKSGGKKSIYPPSKDRYTPHCIVHPRFCAQVYDDNCVKCVLRITVTFVELWLNTFILMFSDVLYSSVLITKLIMFVSITSIIRTQRNNWKTQNKLEKSPISPTPNNYSSHLDLFSPSHVSAQACVYDSVEYTCIKSKMKKIWKIIKRVLSLWDYG